MANSQAGYRKLIDLRNKFLLNQINFNEFLKQIEIILFNYISVSNITMAGGKGQTAYLTITQRLLSEEIGKTGALKNLKIDITYY